MIVLVPLGIFLAVTLLGWVIYALTHPVMAGQGALIFLCKAAGVISLLVALAYLVGTGFPGSIPGFLFTFGFFFAANQLEGRWRRW